MEMNILESRNKSALLSAAEWAARIKAEKRPLHLAAKSLVILCQNRFSGMVGAEVRLQRRHLSITLSSSLAVKKRNKMATMKEAGRQGSPQAEGLTSVSSPFSLSLTNKHVLLVFHSNSVQD